MECLFRVDSKYLITKNEQKKTRLTKGTNKNYYKYNYNTCFRAICYKHD